MAHPAAPEVGAAQVDAATSELIRAMRAERELNRAFFEANRARLTAEHSETWLLIHSGGEVAASDELMALASQRQALDTVQRGGALIVPRPRRPSEPPPPDPIATPPVITHGPLSERGRAIFDEHKRNLEFFEAHREELFARYPKMWLLIHSGGEVVASKSLGDLQDLRETLDSVTRAAALCEIELSGPVIATPFFFR